MRVADESYLELDLDTATFMRGVMAQQPVYLTKQEAADYARVSTSTIKRAIRSGALRSGGTPGLVRIRPEWVDEWLEHRENGRGRPA